MTPNYLRVSYDKSSKSRKSRTTDNSLTFYVSNENTRGRYAVCISATHWADNKYAATLAGTTLSRSPIDGNRSADGFYCTFFRIFSLSAGQPLRRTVYNNDVNNCNEIRKAHRSVLPADTITFSKCTSGVGGPSKRNRVTRDTLSSRHRLLDRVFRNRV